MFVSGVVSRSLKSHWARSRRTTRTRNKTERSNFRDLRISSLTFRRAADTNCEANHSQQPLLYKVQSGVPEFVQALNLNTTATIESAYSALPLRVSTGPNVLGSSSSAWRGALSLEMRASKQGRHQNQNHAGSMSNGSFTKTTICEDICKDMGGKLRRRIEVIRH